jgi:hypothetical protein
VESSLDIQGCEEPSGRCNRCAQRLVSAVRLM